MRLYLDEDVDRKLATHLREQGHDVYEVTADPKAAGKGISDEEHVRRATRDGRVLIAEDKDHSVVRHRDGIGGCGVLYSRNEVVASPDYVHRVASTLEKHKTDLESGRFVTVANNGVRVSQQIEHQPTTKSADQVYQSTQESKPKEAEDMNVRQVASATNSVDELASSYAKANPESGTSTGERREAAYFAHAVEDSDKYPPRDATMRERVEQRQFDEQFEKNYRKGSGEAPREENKQELMQERMQYHMDHQNQKQFRM